MAFPVAHMEETCNDLRGSMCVMEVNGAPWIEWWLSNNHGLGIWWLFCEKYGLEDKIVTDPFDTHLIFQLSYMDRSFQKLSVGDISDHLQVSKWVFMTAALGASLHMQMYME